MRQNDHMLTYILLLKQLQVSSDSIFSFNRQIDITKGDGSFTYSLNVLASREFFIPPSRIPFLLSRVAYDLKVSPKDEFFSRLLPSDSQYVMRIRDLLSTASQEVNKASPSKPSPEEEASH